ncbi:SDR family NAD(P)-dependent oxidoreductase [Nocardia bovistercoris]|uniref:3-oxoacyl-[acyl-carrier-protein] reductase MabA n=1 Tax=Nocardia bovistercoris TaxID=2785916 RepID=A0A931N823_9NOCA|nr:SDR family oxidoreductase [Nocardia bovistercoris]MBH0781328.1 SDR family oxidoreductase [Nocardia bovistercoris]
MDLLLRNEIAVVTGASKGIGLATARTLHAEGALVVAVSRRSSPELDAIAGERLVHVAVDLTASDGPARALGEAERAFGGVDILVNNAGGPPPGAVLPRFSFTALDDADWHAMLEFNLMATVRAVRAAIPMMLARGGGAIVNISSTHAHVPSGVNVDYGVAKAGIGNLTKALSEEFGPKGIRVNTVSPGPVVTPWWTEPGGAAEVIAAATGSDRDTVLRTGAAEMMKLTTGRLIDPQEVADAVVLLCSPRSASTTGIDVLVDAGLRKAV